MLREMKVDGDINRWLKCLLMNNEIFLKVYFVW